MLDFDSPIDSIMFITNVVDRGGLGAEWLIVPTIICMLKTKKTKKNAIERGNKFFLITKPTWIVKIK